MTERDTQVSDPAPALSPSEAGAQGGEPVLAPSIAEWTGDTLIGDVLAEGNETLDASDLHAALVSLSTDTLAYLDVALDHLTASADLFDVPGIDFDDLPHDDTVA